VLRAPLKEDRERMVEPLHDSHLFVKKEGEQRRPKPNLLPPMKIHPKYLSNCVDFFLNLKVSQEFFKKKKSN